MYVFYENTIYKNGGMGCRSVYYYTHKIVVYEKQSLDKYRRYVAKHGSTGVSYSKITGKMYVRTLLRRAKFCVFDENHYFYKRNGYSRFSMVENSVTNFKATIDHVQN